ncbi:MAG TPA: hypothetical protein VFQ61_19420, partial [Polyangiaceae bacterium]|nr:hypothetical protein [Polyangiaceae bacterium]
IESVTLNGTNATRSGNDSGGGNAWVASGQSPPCTVKAKDAVGNQLEATFSGGNMLQDVGKQFTCQ